MNLCWRDGGDGRACFGLGSLLVGDFDFLGLREKKVVGVTLDIPRSKVFFKKTCTAAAAEASYEEWCTKAKQRERL